MELNHEEPCNAMAVTERTKRSWFLCHSECCAGSALLCIFVKVLTRQTLEQQRPATCDKDLDWSSLTLRAADLWGLRKGGVFYLLITPEVYL